MQTEAPPQSFYIIKVTYLITRNRYAMHKKTLKKLTQVIIAIGLKLMHMYVIICNMTDLQHFWWKWQHLKIVKIWHILTSDPFR